MALGRAWYAATSCLNLGAAMMHVGDYARATALFNQALLRYQEQGDEVFRARTQQHLGYIALLQGKRAAAGDLFTRSLRVFVDHDDQIGIADALESLAATRAASGETELALQLLASAAVLHERLGMPPTPYLQAIWEPFVDAATTGLSQTASEAARAEGRAMPLDQAVARALGLDTPRAELNSQ
jgi:tetratricopeptide (TPR) repeat protein